MKPRTFIVVARAAARFDPSVSLPLPMYPIEPETVRVRLPTRDEDKGPATLFAHNELFFLQHLERLAQRTDAHSQIQRRGSVSLGMAVSRRHRVPRSGSGSTPRLACRVADSCDLRSTSCLSHRILPSIFQRWVHEDRYSAAPCGKAFRRRSHEILKVARSVVVGGVVQKLSIVAERARLWTSRGILPSHHPGPIACRASRHGQSDLCAQPEVRAFEPG